MKLRTLTTAFFTALMVLFSSQAFATEYSCAMHTGDIGTITANGPKVAAQKAVWHQCAERRLQLYESHRGQVSLDAGDVIAESCINADVSCQLVR